jgi:hypothetical protein
MTETTSETSAAGGPRFTHISSPGALLREPLPPELVATLTAKQRKEHEQIVARVEEAGREYARLRSALADAPKRDRQAATAAALEGDELPESSEPKLRAQIEDAKRVRAALDDALRTSADRLLAAAAAAAGGVADELEAQLGERADDVRARLADLRDGLNELGELYVDATWTRALAELGERTTISPYQAGRSPAFRATLGELTTIEQALEHDVAAAEGRRREARNWREEQRRLNAQWERERREARAERSTAAGGGGQ